MSSSHSPDEEPPNNDEEPEVRSAHAPSKRLLAVLDRVERIGNALPAPVTIFFLFCVGVVLTSTLAARLGVTVEHPGTGQTIAAVDLLSHDGVTLMLTEAVSNFTDFAPLGTVLVVMIGIGVAERSGLISTGLRQLMAWVPNPLVTATLVFAGIMSSLAADAGYVVLTPLGAVLFAAMGRHPIAGLAAAFAGVSAGYSANLVITSLDPLLAGFTQEAAQLRDPDYKVHAASNLYFMIASVPVMTLLGTYVTTRLVEPRLGPWSQEGGEDGVQADAQVSSREKKALAGAGVAGVACIGLMLATVVPSDGVLRSETIAVEWESEPSFQDLAALEAQFPGEVQARTAEVGYDRDLEPGQVRPVGFQHAELQRDLGQAVELVWPEEALPGEPVIQTLVTELGQVRVRLTLTPEMEPDELAIDDPSKVLASADVAAHPAVASASRSPNPFYNNMVPLLMVFFFVPGLVYGLVARTVKNDKVVEKMTGDTMATMGTYIVLAFVAAQFVAYFSWSNLGLILAVNGAELLKWIGIGGLPLIVAFIVVSAILNIFIGSASAKWGIMAPVFVPMLMQMGYSPETVQLAYRVGDSFTNIITPLLPYFPIIIAFAQKYDRRAGLGTLISAMLPYSIAFGIVWTVMIVVWIGLGVPLGPDTPLTYDPGP